MRMIVIGAEGELGRLTLREVADNTQVTDVNALSDKEAHSQDFAKGDGSIIQWRRVDLLSDLCDQLRFADAALTTDRPNPCWKKYLRGSSATRFDLARSSTMRSVSREEAPPNCRTSFRRRH